MHSDPVQGVREELAAEPRQLSDRSRRFLSGGAALLACSFLLTESRSTGCSSTTVTPTSGAPSAPRWLPSDDPLVRGLHFEALDRDQTLRDLAPEDVLPVDLGPTTRKVGDVGGVAVYLADGPGFACMGVDGRQAHYEIAKQCLLNVSVANQGLYVSISSDSTSGGSSDPAWAPGAEDPILVIAVPDRASLFTSASTEHMADYTSAAVLRAGQDEVLLQQRDQTPIAINRPPTDTNFSASC